MSTFNGLVSEFPDIRIDHFGAKPDARPPLACFLSHVHSDHLSGLESLRSPFVYCSGATREILLRLERYPCRINYAKGILEARKQTYKHLHRVLKPLPLNSPTCLELRPRYQIQVTLLDANHCPGAVMFLVEDDAKAILYTGDIRSEPWFVSSIARSPSLVEYTTGIKTLDKIYLDTSFVDDVPFQTKTEGISELLRKLAKYPSDTTFHIQAWTYGYEDVWIALSKALKSQVHVDDYKMKIYESLRPRSSDGHLSSSTHLCSEAPALVGYTCGNSPHKGCLTSETNVRLHSCEKGNMCPEAQKPSVVHIQPIVARLSDGGHWSETGVGGGGDDLEREAEMEKLTHDDVQLLLKRLSASNSLSREVQEKARALLTEISGGVSFPKGNSADLEDIICALLKKPNRGGSPVPEDLDKPAPLPQKITFPYSRHSSYPELCHFLRVFRPKDVWPCTVDEKRWLKDGITIASLFGKYCTGESFDYDHVLDLSRQEHVSNDDTQRSTETTSSRPLSASSPIPRDNPPIQEGTPSKSPSQAHDNPMRETRIAGVKRGFGECQDQTDDDVGPGESQETQRSFVSSISARHSVTRHDAYRRMLDDGDGDAWPAVPLLSTDGSHYATEREL